MAGGPHVMTPGAGGGSGEILGEQRREDSEYARKNKEFLKRMGLQLSSSNILTGKTRSTRSKIKSMQLISKGKRCWRSFRKSLRS